MPCLWRVPDDYPEGLIGHYVRVENPDSILFRKGVRAVAETSAPIVRFDSPISAILRYACLPNSSTIPLVSAQLGTALVSLAPESVQLIKSKIEACDGEDESFFILNVVSKVSGIDKAQSRFSYITGTESIRSFSRLKYFDDCLGHHLIARESEYLPHILVAEELIAKLRCMNVSTLGAAFLRTSEMSW